MASGVTVDVYFDLICPWCLIGKRNLDRALAQFAHIVPGVAVQLRWHSVQLIPNVPQDGVDYKEFYVRRLGNAETVRARQAQVRQAAQAAGSDVDFASIQRFPNSMQAHQLVSFAAQQGVSLAPLLERLFAAYFQRGEDIGDSTILQTIAAEHGLDVAALTDWIAAGHGRPQPCEVPGVPFFVFNQSHALSGAQPVAALLASMRASLATTQETTC